MIIIEVAIPCPLYQTFDYQLDESLMQKTPSMLIGTRVFLPFGHRKVVGVIVRVKEKSQHKKLRKVEKLLDDAPILTSEQLQLAEWFSQYYHSPIGEVMQLFLPISLRKPVEAYAVERFFIIGEKGDIWLKDRGNHRAKAKYSIVETIAQHSKIREYELEALFPTFRSHRKTLCDSHIIAFYDTTIDYQTKEISPLTAPLFELSKDQIKAINSVDIESGHVYLLEGVTGSGKTAVYIEIARRVLQTQKQVLFLVPEIGLTPQFIERLEKSLQVPYAVIHSSITDNARLLAWQRVSQGEIALVIGTRSSLFTRFQNLGLIIVDEAHDNSYIQAEGIRYSAHNTAIKRANILDIPIILGTATPSLESIYNVEQKRFIHLQLTERVKGKLPEWIVVDCKEDPVFDGLSQTLLNAIEGQLKRKEQTLIFLNRRGYSPAIMCISCGWLPECLDCSSPLNYHRSTGLLHCHHCGYQQTYPQYCPQCNDNHFRYLGVGTQKIEKALADAFPMAKVLRFDRDNITSDTVLTSQLEAIRNQEVDIIIGTQMLAKGHDFENITLVALANPDGLLFSSDFRSEEKLAQELIQVSGRAGRASSSGRVIIQTHYPEHKVFTQLPKVGYHEFIKDELILRKKLNFPPFSYQIVLQAEAKDEQHARNYLEQLLASQSSLMEEIEYTPVMENTMRKRRGFYRVYSVLQSETRAKVHFAVHRILLTALNNPQNQVRLYFEIDPLYFG